jgi:hypothetical protein
MTARRKRDIAYSCFLIPGAACVTAAIAGAFPMKDGNAAAIGFFILIPLTLVALAAIPIGIFYSIVLWRDGVLPFLSIFTLILVVIFLAGGESMMELSGWIYGILVLILEASWFFLRRRAYPT